MPMLHTSTDSTFENAGGDGAFLSAHEEGLGAGPGLKELMGHLHEMKGRKAIYVVPFALNPEGDNPSGHLNFSKVSHSKLTISGNAIYSGGAPTLAGSAAPTETFITTVYGVNYNWLQIKDGRAWISFA